MIFNHKNEEKQINEARKKYVEKNEKARKKAEKKLKKEIERERKFLSIAEAGYYVLEKWKENKEIMTICTNDSKVYYALPIPLDELSISVFDFKPVIDILHLLNIEKSGKNLEDELKKII